MKLGLCKVCKDVFKLIFDVRACRCGKSSGVMRTSLNAQVNGPVVLIGFNDQSLFEAVKSQPTKGPGKEFVAYVLPKENKSVTTIVATNKQKDKIG